MKPELTPTEEEAKSFRSQSRGTIRRKIEPQPWRINDDRRLWAWKRPDSPRDFDCIWVEGEADDMMDEKCPLAEPNRRLCVVPTATIKAESVRAENGPDGWHWVINWRVA